MISRRDQIREVPTAFGSEVFKKGMALYKRQSLPVFLLTFGLVIYGVLSTILPRPLALVAEFLAPVVSIGVLRCLRFLDEAEHQAMVQETFDHFFDSSRRAEYLPLCVVSLAASILIYLIGMVSSSLLLWILIQGVVGVAFFYGLPLVEFNRMPAKDALLMSLDATAKNWKPLTINALLVVGYSILSVLTLGIGFLFLIPVVTVARYYFWQASFDTPKASAVERDVTPLL